MSTEDHEYVAMCADQVVPDSISDVGAGVFFDVFIIAANQIFVRRDDNAVVGMMVAYLVGPRDRLDGRVGCHEIRVGETTSVLFTYH